MVMAGPAVLDEKTPLIAKQDRSHMSRKLDVKDQLLDKQYRQEEQDAVEADGRAPLKKLWADGSLPLAELALPITFVIVLELLPPILISMMIGQVSGANSPKVLAGSSLSDFFQGQVTNCFSSGLGSGVVTLCSQSFGAKQYRQLWIYAQAGVLATVYCIVPIGLLCLNSAALLRFVGQEAELAHIAGILIFFGFLAFPFLMIYTIARSALQAQNIATPFVITSAVSYAVSLSLGYYLGNHTSLGYIGISLSTVVGQALRALSVVPILLRNDLFKTSWPGWQWKEAHGLVRRIWPIGAGSVLMATFQSAGFNTIIMLCGYLPNPAVSMSANNIAATLLSLAFIPMMGLSAGGMTRVGNALGAGQPRRASVAALATLAETLLVSLVGIVACSIVARAYAENFTSDAPTIELATQLVQYLLLIVPLTGVVTAAQGIFQACGAQVLCAKLNFVFLCLLGITLGVVLALRLNGGIYGLWNGFIVGSSCFAAAAAIWWSRLDWHKTAHEAREYAHLHVESSDASLG